MNEDFADIDEFTDFYPEAMHLETERVNGKKYERWTSGNGEGSEHESAYFCADCDAFVEDPYDGCEECDNWRH